MVETEESRRRRGGVATGDGTLASGEEDVSIETIGGDDDDGAARCR